jgi:uncharacterized protein YegP (UPF0339 family)
MTARFEVVRSDAPQPWHARFRAANGRIVWATETYAKRDSAINAITALARLFSPTSQVWLSHVYIAGDLSGIDLRFGSGGHSTWPNAHRLKVRYVDERVTSDA